MKTATKPKTDSVCVVWRTKDNRVQCEQCIRKGRRKYATFHTATDSRLGGLPVVKTRLQFARQFLRNEPRRRNRFVVPVAVLVDLEFPRRNFAEPSRYTRLPRLAA